MAICTISKYASWQLCQTKLHYWQLKPPNPPNAKINRSQPSQCRDQLRFLKAERVGSGAACGETAANRNDFSDK